MKLTKKQRKRRDNIIYVKKHFRKDDPNFILCSGPSELFYKSTIWKEFRFNFLKNNKRMCLLCGRGPGEGMAIQLDHIKPRYLYPELALKNNNIQILCSECNTGKGLQDFKVRTIRRPSLP